MQPDDLAKFLRDDERSGIEAFREQFLEALDHRDLNTCEFLLASIEGISSAPVQHMKSHFQALLFAELRQFDRAESMLRELLEENLSADQKPRTLMELANQLDEQGAGPEAEHYLREALAAFERIGDRRGQAWVLNNHAISITFQIEQGLYVNARLDEAIALHLKAIEIATELDDTDEVARNLHGLGKIYGLRGDYDRAQIEFGHYLAWGRLEENEHDIGFTLSDMAALALQPQGKMAQAKAALDEAIVLLRHSDDDLDLAEAYTRRGKLLEAVGDDDAALEDLNRGVRHAELQRARLAVPVTRVGYRATADFIYTALVSHYLRRGLLMDAFTAAEQARARVLADLLASQIDRQAPIQSELAALRSELTQQVEAARADKKPEHEVTILERELAGVNRRIELTASVHATLGATKSFTAEDVQRRLPEASALLSYMVDAQDELWILVLTKSTIQAVHIKNLTLRWLQNYLVEYLDGIYRGELVPQPATG
ncbi:MAG: tetratricopeptide repeat protein, partial [Caldilineaceae bacterium]|nr:tetratricopeptide repeat protein [Caldilineaceae bacterium]